MKIIHHTHTLLIILLFFLQGSSVIIAQCNHPDDYTALRALYLETDGDNWTDNTGWPTSSQFLANPSPPIGIDMSGWYGIRCSNGRIYCVDLDGNLNCSQFDNALGNNLNGSLPSEINKLQDLEVLNLSNNQLNGTIPSLILSKLKFLSIHSNKLIGSVPILNSPNLIHLNLGFNQLTGIIPNFIFPNLKSIFLYGNMLSGDIPNFKLPNLTQLWLNNNLLSGYIPKFDLPQLKELILSYNQLDGNIPNFIFPNLETLDLSSNKLSGEIPNFNFPYLTSLTLGGNLLSGNIPNFILPNLRILGLSTNQLEGNIPNLYLPNLFILALHSNKLTGIIPNFNLPNLAIFSLWQNQLTGNIPDFNLPKLNSLQLDYNQLSGNIPNFNLPKLRTLSISENLISGEIPNFNLPNLSELNISNNMIKGCIPPSFNYYCDSILVEDINNNVIKVKPIFNIKNNPLLPWQGDFTQFCATDGSQQAQIGAPCDNGNPADGTNDVIQEDCSCGLLPPCNHPDYAPLMALFNSTNGPGWTNKTGWEDGAAGTNCDPCNGWYGISCENGRVYSLELVNNLLIGTLPESIDKLTNLRHLALLFNNLTGSIPVSIGNLVNIENLSLRFNKFIGEIPINLNNLNKLKILDLGNNDLTGEIPSLIGNLGTLQYLNLSSNQLSGEIPASLGNLSNLKELSLTNNLLAGSIPSELSNLHDTTNIKLNINKLSGCYPASFLKFCNSNNFNSNNNDLLPWQGDFSQFCSTNGSQQAQSGAPCYNGNFLDGGNDVIQGNCTCGLLPPCNHPDYAPLMALYNSTNGPNWTNKTGWEDGAAGNSCDPCNFNGQPWYGIQCSNGNVASLILINNKLTGSIPNFNLPYLQNLQLFNNQLGGSIPNFNLPSLKILSISDNQLTGSIPNFNLPSLYELSLSNNQLTGSIPYFTLPNLTYLELQNNQLSGVIPNFNLPNFGMLADTCVVILSNNRLSGCFPIELKNFCDRSFYTDNNPLLPWQGDFSQFCATDGSHQAQIGAPCDNGNPADGTNDVIQDDCSCGLIPPCNHPDFAPLLALFNSTNGPGWTNKTGWEDGAAGNSCDPCNGWYGITCENGRVVCIDMDGFPDCSLIISVGPNKLVGTIPYEISGLTYLKYLNLAHTNVGGSIPSSIGNLAYLEELYLYGNRIVGKIPVEIAKLENLNNLWLSNNQLNGEIPNLFGNLLNLERLLLGGNQLTGTIPAEIGNLSNLIKLELGLNQLSGEIPNSFGNLSNLTALLLSGNKLSGTIPAELGDLSKLIELSLSINQLSGTIPKELTNLVQLNVLRLNDNNLEGCMDPAFKFFCNKIVNFSNNPLLPWQGDFSKFCTTDGSLAAQRGAKCDNGNIADGTNDVIDQNCNCVPCPTSFATITGINAVCQGASATFTAVGGTSYLWSNGATTADITVNTAGTYSVTVTNANGCEAKGERILTINAGPTAAINGANEICEGSSTEFAATGGVSYVWNTTETTDKITLNSAGSYSVTVTNIFGCTSTTTKTLAVNNVPIATIIGESYVCPGQSATFTAFGGINYFWSNGETTAEITVNTAGTYSVTVTDAIGCVAKGERILTINAGPTAAINGANEICEGSSTEFTATGGISYVWNTTATTDKINVNTAGIYSVTVIDANGCSSESNKTLAVNNAPSATISGVNVICEGTITVFTASGGAGYVWSTGATTDKITLTTSGTYTVSVTNLPGCTSSSNKTLTVIKNPMAEINGTSEICEGENSILTASGGVNYVWNTGATTSAINVGSPGPYVVSVSSDSGCVDTTSIVVTLLDVTMLSQVVNDTLYVNKGNSYQVDLLQNDILFTDSIKVQLDNIPEAFIRLLSNNQRGRITLEVKEVFNETLEIDYEVCDPCNPCVTGKLIILNEKLKEIIQTTIITPLESTNNKLQFSSESIPDSELWIYNRWGQQIQHSKNYQNDWDAVGYPGGVYYYVFKVYGFTIKRTLTVVK